MVEIMWRILISSVYPRLSHFLRFSILLPPDESFQSLSEQQQLEYLAADQIEIGVDTQNSYLTLGVRKVFISDGFMVVEILAAPIVSEMQLGKRVYLSYIKSMVASRQYARYGMLSPSFSLENFSEAIRLTGLQCQ